MQRISAPELLDSDLNSPREVEIAMRDIGRVNRWFGGVSTTQALIARVARQNRRRRFSLLEVAAGSGEVPEIAATHLARQGITVDVTLLDRDPSHLPRGKCALAADALALPFPDASFDLLACTLFAHHLDPQTVAAFVREALRVSRCAVLINDLVRHPVHLALAYAGLPIMRSRIAWRDGLTSVRRAYTPDEMQAILTSAFPAHAPQEIEISRHYMFRMGVIVWNNTGS